MSAIDTLVLPIRFEIRKSLIYLIDDWLDARFLSMKVPMDFIVAVE